MPSIRPRDRQAFLQAVLVGIAYVLVFQLAFFLMPFTTEALWLFAFGLAEAISRGQPSAFFASGEWWLALAFPIGIFALGLVGAYAYLAYTNPWPAVVAGVFLAIFYLTEVVFMGTFEYAILFIAMTPLVALLAIAIYLLGPHRRTAISS